MKSPEPSTADEKTHRYHQLRSHNRLAKLITTLVAGSMYAAMSVCQLLNAEPEFYIAKLDRATLVEHGRKLQAQLDQLIQPADAELNWSATFTEEQINGWLVGQLPQRLPRLLPKGVHEPRIAIEDDRIQVACKYKNGNMEAVLALEAMVFLTEQPTEIGFQLIDARIGAVRGLTDKAVETLTRACKRSDVDIRWLESAELPTAIVQLPASYLESQRQFNLESLDVEKDTIRIAATIVPSRTRPILASTHSAKFPGRSGQVKQLETTGQPGTVQFKFPFLGMATYR